uniref:PDZ domain-containing protein n=2 Tax=Timema TaxID=61471 RepID=A0A7R9PH50_TIMGE|nr:unnamed protein product [Timema genevievae]
MRPALTENVGLIRPPSLNPVQRAAGVSITLWEVRCFHVCSARLVSGKHLVLVTDPEGGKDDYAFDNPCFRDGTPIGRSPAEKDANKMDPKVLLIGRALFSKIHPWCARLPVFGSLVQHKSSALDHAVTGVGPFTLTRRGASWFCPLYSEPVFQSLCRVLAVFVETVMSSDEEVFVFLHWWRQAQEEDKARKREIFPSLMNFDLLSRPLGRRGGAERCRPQQVPKFFQSSSDPNRSNRPNRRSPIHLHEFCLGAILLRIAPLRPTDLVDAQIKALLSLFRSQSPDRLSTKTHPTDKKRRRTLALMLIAYPRTLFKEPQVNVVSLRSHDFTGLGFNICGNMRDGIYIKDVLHRGPASESGRITPGDRIDSVRISFRHMVFEDALTILSYASPYEVQLEVESAASSRPSTLIRTKRTSVASIGVGDRICHPFYRSQSIADLAQIGKASIKRMQQMDSITKSPKMPKSESVDDSAAGDYPTLKLSSSSGVDSQREHMKIERTAATVSPVDGLIIKPERAKRTTPRGQETRAQERHGSPGSEETVSKFHKFGVRVLPDPNYNVSMRNSQSEDGSSSPTSVPALKSENVSGKPTTVEPEKHQNEQNIIIERGKSTSSKSLDPIDSKRRFSDQKSNSSTARLSESIDVVDSRRPIADTFYDERGIDVGPVELQKQLSKGGALSGNLGGGKAASGKHSTTEAHPSLPHVEANGDDNNKESNVKQLITKGFQNLKEKLHHIDRKKSGSTSETTDDESQPQNEKDTKEPKQTESKNIVNVVKDTKKEGYIDEFGVSDRAKRERNIPTEIPEEVQKAAMAARSNRKSMNNPNTTITLDENISTTQSQKRIRTISQDSLSEDSSNEGDTKAAAASYDTDSERMLAKPNKRKAPPPPSSKDAAESHNSHLKFINNDLGVKHNTNGTGDTLDLIVTSTYPDANSSKLTTQDGGKILTTFANLARHFNNPETSTIDEANTLASHNISIETSKTDNTQERMSDNSSENSRNLDSTSVKNDEFGDLGRANSEYNEDRNLSEIHTDSDSDLERLEADEESYDSCKKSQKGKKGGTTIELNSSHITIHHSPPPDMAALENENTRKAASLGDLSRLDSEQPMSILERAVSLDLADGGTPHGTKKRKAPLPPPGDEFLPSCQDSDDGTSYKKEPRLDGAMDTFQRRRLKKSSDWGTMEEALQQTDAPPSPHKSFTDPKTLNTFSSVTETHITFPINSNQSGTTTVTYDNTFDKIGNPNVNINHQKNSSLNDTTDLTILKLNDSKATESYFDHFHKDNSQESSALNSQLDGIGINNQEDIEDDDGCLIQQQNNQQKMVLHINKDSNAVTSQVIIAPTSIFEPKEGASVSTRKNTDIVPSLSNTACSPDHPTRRVVSSTPFHMSSSEIISSTPIRDHPHQNERHPLELVQSPLVTSSNTGISSVHVSSTQNNSDFDSSILVTSATDPYFTASSTVDSTTAMFGDTFDDEHDSQPPELPTSPIPVINTSSYATSPSMTYITEIQVVTTRDEDAGPSANIERSRIPMRVQTESSGTSANENMNHLEVRKLKPVRPPVPPRKSDTSSPSLVTVQFPSLSNHTPASQSGTGKFISFSSLTPRTPESGVGRNSSFEKWVFLEDGNNSSSKFNGLESTANEKPPPVHPTEILTNDLPVLSSRAQHD